MQQDGKRVLSSAGMDRFSAGAMLGAMYGPTRIREWRKRRGLTQEQLAAAAGISAGSMSRIERGLQPYDQPKLEAMAATLQVEVADLVRKGDPTPEDLELQDAIAPLNAPAKRQVIAIVRAISATPEFQNPP